MSAANFRTLVLSKHHLLVRCRRCDKHAVIEAKALGATEHTMEPLNSLKLKCSRCGCRDVDRQVTWVADGRGVAVAVKPEEPECLHVTILRQTTVAATY
jgi:hypothetical protein